MFVVCQWQRSLVRPEAVEVGHSVSSYLRRYKRVQNDILGAVFSFLGVLLGMCYITAVTVVRFVRAVIV